MKKKIVPWLSVLLLTVAPNIPAHAAYQSEVLEDKKVGFIEIRLENAPSSEVFDPKQIESKMKTKVGEPFSQSDFDSDLKFLSEEYERIEPRISIQNNQIYIAMQLWRKSVIEAIDWNGNTHISDKKLNKILDIKPGTTFERGTFNKAFNKVKEHYIKEGYFESSLEYHLEPSEKPGEVLVKIQVDEGRSGKIAKLEFVNFSGEEESKVLQAMITKKHNLFLSWLTGTGIYNEEMVDQDTLVITNLLQNEGYADASVRIEAVPTNYDGWILLRVEADKGERYHFGDIEVEGHELFTKSELQKALLIRQGDPYSPEKLRETQNAIKELYGRKGYIDASVQYESIPEQDAPLYDVKFVISEGGQYRIGLVHIFGNTQTNANVILRESLLVPGEVFDTARLKATEMRLMNVGFFKSVNVYAVRSPDDVNLGDNYRDVYIELEETTTGNVSLFFGLSTADSIFGGLDLTETNFNYKGIARLFKDGPSAMRGAGEYLHGKFSVGSRQKSYSLSWLDPYFYDTLWRFGIDGNYTQSRLISDAYHQKITTFTMHAGYPLLRFLTFNTKYKIRNSRIHVSKTKEQAAEVQQNPSQDPNKDVDKDGVISMVGTSISWDSCDHPIKPHRGLRSMLEGEFAGLGGDAYFARLNFMNTYYFSFWKRGIFKARFDMRFIQPVLKTPHFKDIPLSERFFLGGETTVRGYQPFSIGPKNDTTSEPTGGLSSSLGSFEYTHEVFPPFLDLFAFFDAGYITQAQWSVDTYRCTVGVGARVDVMNRLPFMFGVGFPLNLQSKEDKRTFFFTMGGQF